MRPLRHLARIRLNLGLPQAELGQRSGFSQQYVSMLERGLMPSDPNHVVRLAAVLGVDLDALTADRLNICIMSPSGNVTVNCA